MKKQIEDWLHLEVCICEKTGLLKDNIIFSDHKTECLGKGSIAATHGITHFVDDSLPVLQSFLNHTKAMMGIDPIALFYFPRSGLLHDEIWCAEEEKALPSFFKQVHSWKEILQMMKIA